MKRTKKYTEACEILTFPHSTQQELYSELNRLGYYWNSKKKMWERDERLSKPASKLIKIRVWCGSNEIENITNAIVDNLEDAGLQLLERSDSYPCRPPQQNDSRIYLTFQDIEETE